MNIDSTTKVYLGGVEQVRIMKDGVLIWEKQIYNTDYFYIENTYAGSNTITFTTTSTEPVTGTYADSIEYSKDKTVWTTLTFVPGTPQTVTLNQGEKLYLRNSSGNFNSTGYYTYIKGSESHDAGGDIMTLVDYTSQNPTVPERCFYYLFFNNTGLVSASLLTMPSTTNSFSFTYMFRGCTSLTGTPSLPATTLVSNCYNAMFQGCTALTAAPALPATTLGGFCYRSMFSGCTALTTAPALPATTLVSGCYRLMFNGCTSLTAAPVLPAKTLATNCYYDMFNGCTSLNEVTTYANDISATDCITNWLNSVASSGTFNNFGTATYTPNSASGIPTGWTEYKTDYLYVKNESNNQNTLQLNVTKQNWTSSMDKYAATSVEYSTDRNSWTTASLDSTVVIQLGVGETVYFRNNSGKWSYTQGFASFSQNKYMWLNSTEYFSVGGNIMSLLDYTNIDTVNLTDNFCFRTLFSSNKLVDCSDLKLPATTLKKGCYYSLFASSQITTAPVLQATTIAQDSYTGMFRNCTYLNYVKTFANNIPAGGFLDWLYGVSATGDFYNLGGATYPSGTSGIPSGWTEHTSL